MFYVPDEDEREIFERYIEREGLKFDSEIQEAWRDFCDDLDSDRDFNSGRRW